MTTVATMPKKTPKPTTTKPKKYRRRAAWDDDTDDEEDHPQPTVAVKISNKKMPAKKTMSGKHYSSCTFILTVKNPSQPTPPCHILVQYSTPFYLTETNKKVYCTNNKKTSNQT
jgi:hypothetical protein